MDEVRELPQLHCNGCKDEVDDEMSRIIGKGVLVSPADPDEDDENTEHYVFHMNCFHKWFDSLLEQEQVFWSFEMNIAPIGDIAAGLFTESDDEL